MGRSCLVRLAGALAVSVLLLAACGGDDGDNSDADAGSEQPTTSADVPTTGGDGAAGVAGVAVLTEVNASGVSGEATLVWSPDTRALEVTVELVGVAEGATYAGMITPGCGPGTGHIHALGDALGEPDGTSTLSTKIADVDAVDLDGGWAIKVARPPAGPQACGQVAPR